MDTGQHHTGSGFRNVHNNNFTLRVETEAHSNKKQANGGWKVELSSSGTYGLMVYSIFEDIY